MPKLSKNDPAAVRSLTRQTGRRVAWVQTNPSSKVTTFIRAYRGKARRWDQGSVPRLNGLRGYGHPEMQGRLVPVVAVSA